VNLLITKALKRATTAHAGAFRKYTENEPYITHPISVAKMVAEVGGDHEMIAAALLHDVVEDTEVTLEEVSREFGPRIGMLVENLTDVSRPSDGNRRMRKALDLNHTAVADPDAKTIKLADLIDNSETIVEKDPGFSRVYMAEKKALLEVLSDGHPVLFSKARSIIDKYYSTE